MSRGDIKLFVVEGQESERKILDSIKSNFFSGDNIRYVTIPSGGNIYMLYNQLKQDDFDTDLVEVLKEKWTGTKFDIGDINREQVSEIFLFYDYDAHQRNLPKGVDIDSVLLEMLDKFSDETDLGKLYICYPMIEATRDWKYNTCESFTYCIIDKNLGSKYKELSSTGNKNADIRYYNHSTWINIINVFVARLSCLFDLKITPQYSYYKKNITPTVIYGIQKSKYSQNDKIFILSALPEFLLDYYGEEFWNSAIGNATFIKEACELK